ncbi:hypothetical protein MAM1_0002c00179 [Mucor ambiguus]|uniref:Uncharacterized protein n=1 Tax=Mucor ambiguus TaxID=91626 RepID=A0A0C9MCZ1_9FUNG|nr:hypothetical protein MAM1_0002c00179 [Mucor ambiguus]
MNTTMDMNLNADGRNVMPETHILGDENNLPAQFVAAKRISMKNFMDKPNEFRNTVQDHCIKKGKPLVISDMNTLPGWDDGTFSLDQLKLYRGNESSSKKKSLQTHSEDFSEWNRIVVFASLSQAIGVKTTGTITHTKGSA